MPNYRYLVIGGGMTAYAAIHGIRDIDMEGSIGLIGAEPHPPYKRPPLSKGLWQGTPLEKIWYRLEDFNVTLHPERTAQSLDTGGKTVVDDRGDRYSFSKLLIATGGATVKLPFGGDDIIYFRNLADYYKLRELSERKQRFAVVGGGFIGSEIAAALAINGKAVAMVFPEEGICAALFPHELNQYVNGCFTGNGVAVLPRHTVTGLTRTGESFALHVRRTDGSGDHAIDVDAVIAGIGIRPNVALAEQAGLTVENGIVVDELLRTENPDIFAAGDVANFYNPHLAVRMRAEHEDNALAMGQCAGRNMAGASQRYHHLPYFYSNLFDLSYEAVGKTDSRLETAADWAEPYRKGVLYYLEQGRVRGVLLWDVWEQLDAARDLIAKPGPFAPADLKGKLLV